MRVSEVISYINRKKCIKCKKTTLQEMLDVEFLEDEKGNIETLVIEVCKDCNNENINKI